MSVFAGVSACLYMRPHLCVSHSQDLHLCVSPRCPDLILCPPLTGVVCVCLGAECLRTPVYFCVVLSGYLSKCVWLYCLCAGMSLI